MVFNKISLVSNGEIFKQAPRYEQNLMDYLAKGRGLMILHGDQTGKGRVR